jgi:hypothetical protein
MLVKGINQLFWAMFADTDNIYSQDEFNLEDVMLMFFRKCNVFDTLPSTILIAAQIKALDYINESIGEKWHWLTYPHYTMLYIADFAGFWTNIAESSYSLTILFDRFDLYNGVKLICKLFKQIVTL